MPSEFRNYCTEDVCCVDKYVYLTNVKSLLRCFLFAVPGFGFHFSSCRALDIPLEEDCGMFDLAHHATGV